ncbi:MAG: class I SAM-dependent methyltransferase [Pseudorhodobacter sp.]
MRSSDPSGSSGARALRFDGHGMAHVRSVLLGPQSDVLIRYMQAHGLSQDISGFDQDVIRTAHELGWISDRTGMVTKIGRCAADSCREYRFWLDRNRALPFAGAAKHLDLDRFKGQSVLEIGSGMGANLMSLSHQGVSVIGVEPLEAYSQMGTIFSEREGLTVPDVIRGNAENLPFDDDEIDLILCVSAHQYFDLRKAFDEMVRVLRPGGEVIIIGGTLGTYASGFLHEVFARPSNAKSYIMTILNTLGYSAFGRRIIPARGGVTTARPIYPARSRMTRLLCQAGLHEKNPPARIGPESCFHMCA